MTPIHGECMVLTKMTTHERYCPPRGFDYDLMCSDDGINAMLVGVTENGEGVMKSDAEIFTKTHPCGERRRVSL